MVIVQQVFDGSWIDWLDVFHLLKSKCWEVRYVSCSFKCVRMILQFVDLEHVMVVFNRFYRGTDIGFFIGLNV